ncbi:MAG: type II toxin-antitoxin system RelE/ParE family toxin [Chlorobi bacterium]|nr:type II toxin-antitoxin system RelE/ParE family toxin [Chlorobiota bacterium]
MELKIYWTDFAKNELHKIYSFYKNIASVKTAIKIATKITKKVNILIKQPNVGQSELFLSNYEEDFKYLVCENNFKIIYWINIESNRIEIVDVFDTRQNPSKMIKKR